MGSRERKEREKDIRRDEILKAGERLFLRKGLYSTTMDEIARECELAKGTLYLYFKSKEQLYLSILLRALTVMYDLMSEFQQGVSEPVQRLRMIGEAHFHFYRENPGFFRLLHSSADSSSFHREDLRDVGEKIQKKNEELMLLSTSIIEDGIKSGVFRKGSDPVEISVGLHAISTTMTMMMDLSTEEDGEGGNHSLSRETLKRMMNRNCGRLIYTILAEQPGFDSFSEEGKNSKNAKTKKPRTGAKEAM